MKLKTLLAALLISSATSAALAQESNILSVPAVEGVEGRKINVPVELSNTNPDITAMQFVIDIPTQPLSVSASSVKLTSRTSDHVISVTSKGSGKYLIIVYSPTNSPFSLNKGAVLNIPCSVLSGLTEGTEYPITIEDAILSDRNGENVLSLAEAGVFRVRNGADFTVQNVTAVTTDVNPGDKLTLSYTVKNAGGSESGGWSERVYLTTDAGDECFIGRNTPAEQSLAAGATLQRTVDLTVPDAPGLNGPAKVTVKVVPDDEQSEPLSYRDNNSASTSGTPVRVGAVLSLTPATATIDEASGNPVKCKITRSGSWQKAQTFSISVTPADSRLLLPESVEIPAGQSGAYFLIKAADNDSYDENGKFHVNVSGNSYNEAAVDLTVTDDECPELELSATSETLTEGELTTLTVERINLWSDPVTVTLSCDMPSRFHFPAVIEFDAGEKNKTVTVEAVDNDDIEAEGLPLFKVSAPGYDGDECVIVLKDNDAPALHLDLMPSIVPENAGPVAVTATLRRLSGSSGRIKVMLSDDSGKDIYYPTKSVILEEGQNEINFPLGVIDNTEKSGDRTVNITAAVNIASCSCTVATDSQGAATAALEITEDDGPALSMSLGRTTLIAGAKEGVKLTVRRNSDDPVALDVALSATAEGLVNFPASVNIPAGQRYVETEIFAAEEASIDSDTVITFLAEAPDYSKGSCVMMMSHSNYPDASIPALTLDKTEAFSDDKTVASVTVRNEGVVELPEATRVNINLGGNRTASLYTTKALVAGDEEILSTELPLGDGIGVREVYATVNDSRQIRELNYTNNRSQTARLEVKAPYDAIVTADKETYNKGEDIILTGTVTGRSVSAQPVEIYLINGNLRQTVSSTTDASGNFTATFKPYGAQRGHFGIGACYPGENAKAETASFEILGIERADAQTLAHEVYIDEKFNGNFRIRNACRLPLKGLKVKVLSVPDSCNVEASCPTTLDGNGTASVEFTITPGALTEGPKYQTIELEVETSEGATLRIPVYYYCLTRKGLLRSDLPKLSARVIKGTTRIYPITITNRGEGVSGEISISAPEWIAMENGSVPSLAPGESSQINLLLTPGEEFQLNTIREGSVAFNCENGTGFVLPFSIETVSDTNGVLLVDATDEFTYYTEEGPHLAGAKVLVQHPVTGAKIAEGITGADGLFSVPLPQGYYTLTVSAEKHRTFSGNIMVEPGDDPTYTLITLGYIAHSFEFDVVKTETGDEYDVVTTPNYETNVPVPVVTIDGPERINGDDMADGESVLLVYTITNQGLVTAFNTRFLTPDDTDEWSWELLDCNAPFELHAHESVEIPVKITRHIVTDHSQRAFNTPNIVEQFRNCVNTYRLLFEHECGRDWKNDKSAKKVIMKMCADEAIASGIMGALFGGWNGTGSNDGGGVVPNHHENNSNSGSDKEPTPFNMDRTLCNPCWADFADKNLDRATGMLPFGDKIAQGRNAAYDLSQAQDKGGKTGATPASAYRRSTRGIRNVISNMLKNSIPDDKIKGAAGDALGFVNDAIDYEECLKDLSNKKNPNTKSVPRGPRKAREMQDWVKEHVEITKTLSDQYQHFLAGMTELLGDSIWVGSDDPAVETFLGAFGMMDEWTVDACMPIKPASVTTAQLEAFVERMNNTVEGTGENRCDIDVLTDELIATGTADTYAANNGFKNMTEMYSVSAKDFLKKSNEQSSSVCASVGLAIDQTLSMTREAFLGYLKIFNGDDISPMENIVFNLEIRNLSTGKKVTDREMQIDIIDLEVFGGEASLGSLWTLGAQSTGKASFRFIPTRYAAPVEPVDYSFGGVITYLDPITGMQVTERLLPVIKTVSPSPLLDLTYFLQRDVYADDPLTEEIEPAEDAEMALVIHNKGYGDARNVKLITQQPQIVDNEKGLLLDFSIVSSQMNGGEKALSFGGEIPMEIGTICTSESSYLQWWLRSSLLGHFTDYDVDYVHLTSHGNTNLSLIDQLSIHELIRGFSLPDTGASKVRGFLANDLSDKDDMPDAVYFSDGSAIQPINIAESVKMSAASSDEYIVEITPSASGWNYGFTPDRSGGQKVIKAVHRVRDNVEIPLDNFWQTSVTLRDGLDPVHQNLIHTVAEVQGKESYRLTFVDRQNVRLDVSGLEPQWDASDDEGLYVSAVKVTFNKDIDPSTFATEDLILFRDGTQWPLDSSAISTVSNNEFNVSLGKMATKAGAYELKVLVNKIHDNDGVTGQTNRSVAWTQLNTVSVGIADLEEDAAMHVYPLPMRDILFVEGNFERIYKFEVVDATSGIVARNLEIAPDGSVDVSDLVRGLYIIRIYTDNGIYVRKAFKL